MSLITLAVPQEYGYVVTAVTSTFFVGFWHGGYAASFRKAAGVFAPKMYAETADITAADNAEKKKALYLLNCAQRAHANYLENQPAVIAAMLIAGVKYPVVTASMGAIWSVARIIYALGYTRKDKNDGKGRVLGFLLSMPIQLGLWGMAAWTGISMVL